MNDSLMAGVVAGLLCLTPVYAQAQTAVPVNAKTTQTPEVAKATPRMVDGHPDLNGQWYHRIGAPAPLVKPGQSYNEKQANAPGIIFFEPGKPSYKAEYVDKVKKLDERQIDFDPAWHCGPPGVPRIGPPQKIVQTAKEIVFLYDDLSGNFFRVVRMNVPHRTNIDPSAHGDSVGHWDGDTLVVDVTNLDDATWLEDDGMFHTDKLHVTETLRRDGDTLTYQATAEDPTVLTAPFKESPRILKLMNYEIEEAPPCIEKDRENISDLGHHHNTR